MLSRKLKGFLINAEDIAHYNIYHIFVFENKLAPPLNNITFFPIQINVVNLEVMISTFKISFSKVDVAIFHVSVNRWYFCPE